MKRTLSAAALLMAGLAWSQDSAVTPGASIQNGIRTRLERDIEALREAAEEEGVPVQTRSDVLGELAAVEGELGQASAAFGDDFRAVLPLNSWHGRVLRTQAWLWRARGLELLTFWRSNLWDPLLYIGMPNSAAALTAGRSAI